MKVKIVGNKYILGDFVFLKEELDLIMEEVPELPEGVVSLYYEDHKTTQSTGKASKVITGAWPEVDWMVQNVNYLIQGVNTLRNVKGGEEPPTLSEALASHRYDKEEGGIGIGELFIQTKRSSRADILGARIEATADNNYTLDWKTDTGFITLDAASIIQASSVVSAHVRQCFIIEKEVLALIDNETLTTVQQVTDKFDELYATWLAALYASLQP